MERARGVLVVARSGTGLEQRVHEEALPFSSLDDLLLLCAKEGQGAGLLRVELTGMAGGQRQHLVLDVGLFGPSPEDAP